jgi:type II secretory pathway pseudopilin PulG
MKGWIDCKTGLTKNAAPKVLLQTRYAHPCCSRKPFMALHPERRVFRKSCERQSGYSLPEILIALACSSLLMMILMNQYLGMKRYYKHAQVTLEQGLDVQLIIDMMRDSIRQAGFTPCLGIEQLISLDTRTNQTGLTAIELRQDIASAIQINHMRNEFATLIKFRSPTTLEITKNVNFDARKPIIIADCYHAEVHSLRDLDNISGALIMNLEHSVMSDFHPPVFVGEWLEESFFVRNRALYYQLGHADMLSTAIHELHVTSTRHRHKRIVHLAMLVGDDGLLQVDTLVRTS